MFAQTSLLLNPNGTIYHLALFPDEIADTIITVGDPERVSGISKHFDYIEIKRKNREFVTHTGYLNRKRLTVLSTGIGTDNIDICINELDALANIDFQTRTAKKELTSLNIIRLGTSGSLQPDLPINSFLLSKYALGLDNLLSYYHYPAKNNDEIHLQNIIYEYLAGLKMDIKPYLIAGSDYLFNLFADSVRQGITATCVGFYGPQGRQLRAALAFPDLVNQLQSFNSNEICITNFEMETSGIYALGRVLDHQCCSLSAIIVNRATNTRSENIPELVEKLIKLTLEKLTQGVSYDQSCGRK